MIKPWISIDIHNAMVTVDHQFGDIRIQFKDVATIDSVIAQLEEIRSIVKEMEEVK